MSLSLAVSVLAFTVLDWVVFGVLLYSVVVSATKGFVREVLGLAVILAGLLLASWFYQDVGGLAKDLLRTDNLAWFFGFTIVFLATIVAGFAVIWVLSRFFKFARIEWFDRLLGAAFGLVRGWVFGSIIFLTLTSFEIQLDAVKKSQFAPYFLPGSRVIAVVAPFELKAKFLLGYREIERWWLEHE